MERLLEHTSKITDIFKSALHGNISDRHVVRGEHPFSFFHTHIYNIGIRIFACNYTYLPIELRFAYAHFFGYPIRIE